MVSTRLLSAFVRVVDEGYFCYPAFLSDPWLDGLRGAAAFDAIMETAKARHASAARAFREADGDALLGR